MDEQEEKIIEALKRVIPLSCLPSDVEDHEHLADLLITELAGDVVFCNKKEYDKMVRELRGYRNLDFDNGK